MASLGCEQQIATNNQTAESVAKGDAKDGSMDRKDRDEKLKIARERQNEERQRKIEELKAQAEAAQRYREQKEEERRRRIEEIRHRDIEKRQQVEERKRAIMEAEKERREYIIKKNEERESRLEAKKKERNSIVFAFGSSTPRLLESDFGMVSPSTFWGNRRSTSISNVAGASLSRRSSERELVDSTSKKRATSASGTDRHDGHRRKSSSMYEVFNWGNSNEKPPKRVSLSIVGGEINIDVPPPSTYRPQILFSTHSPNYNYLKAATNDCASKEDKADTSHIILRSVARRKTDLMPTIPSPRDGYYGSRSSLSNTPKTPGQAYSLNRLDQLAQPIRRNGEHIHSILERERRNQCMEMLEETEYLRGGQRLLKRCNAGSCSRSMSHLAGGRKYNMGGGISSNFRPLSGSNRESCRSMSQLTTSWATSQTIGTKQCLQSPFIIPSTKRGQHFTNTYRYHPHSLLLMNSSFVTTGSRSGNVTPGDSINTSRPGSAMSTSTNLSTSGNLARRSGAPMRKPRPASIAGTGVSLEEINKLKKDSRPPLTSSSVFSSQTTPKRTSNMMSTSLILNSSSRLSSAEKKTPSKKESLTTKFSTPKPLSKTTSVDKLNKTNKEQKPKYTPPVNRSSLVSSSVSSVADPDIISEQRIKSSRSKDEKNALNTVKTEEPNNSVDDVGPISDNAPFSVVIDEKIDQGNEKDSDVITKKVNRGSKENSEARELTEAVDMMSISMISKSKITTEEEAKAALAERRRIAREEAEKQAELDRQRLESERLAQKQQQEEEIEQQRKFEEEAIRLAAEQRKAEEERLRQAIEETKQREKDEQAKREEEENLKVEREEAEKKAKEEAEKQRLEVVERLKREEKEREERRKRVEAIMSRTRKAGAPITPNTTPVKENNENSNKAIPAEQIQQPEKKQITIAQNNVTSSPTTPTVTTITPSDPISMYEGLADKDDESITKTSSMVNEENTKNLQQLPSSNVEVANIKLKHADFPSTEVLLLNTNTTNLTVANGNGHIGNINTKTDFNILQDVLVTSTNQVIDQSIESQDNNSPTLNNNNTLLKTNTLVTDSLENKDISLL